MKIHSVKDIAHLEYVTTFGRPKKDFPERIWEYSNIAALYYVWSQKLKNTVRRSVQSSLGCNTCVDEINWFTGGS